MVERPIQISEASGKWRFQGSKGNLPPIRSGSAPPSIEGSFAAIENLMSRNSIRVDHSNLSTHKEESGDIRSPKQELSAEAGIADSNPTTTSVSSSPSLDGTEGNMVLKPPMSTRSNTRSQDHGSASGVADAAVSAVRHEMDSLNISNFPKLESEVVHAGPHSQTVPLPQTYVGTDQFLQNPILPSLGFGYMTAETSMYPNIMAAGYIPQQYAIGGYAFNPPHMSPYETGYLFPNPYPTPFGNMVPGFSGQSQTSGVNLQHLNNFYAHFGLPSWEQQILQSLGGVGHVNLNSGSVGTVNPYYLGSPTNIDFLQSLNLPVASPLMPGSPIGGVSYPGRRNESGYGGWRGHNGNYAVNDPKTNSLLDELKLGKGRRLELSEIYGHIVEFSVDQYGSRFIQQKLEICSNEERESIFKEVLPHASKLITDVFGNYVIQKIFEYGNAEQRWEFGSHLEGQILSLSLHVYGCRVIQKALEAFDLEQKIKIAHELEEHVLKCVCDQNGNHVIQKCIECLPTENVKILISSFRGRVESVSKHPFGCRVIQRVLECSRDELQTQFIVDEILDSVYGLAQDQYGNYVAQYVLGARTPEERSQIVHKLAGHVVRLSQHKFASNVIEKCLEFGDEAARQLMIKEITESTDGNDNLLVLVKDQYANYVVQKVLQVCSGHQRESLLGRIKIHLNLLKKYTYGKHIVARFEQFYGEEIEAPGSTLQQPKSDGNRQSV